MKFISLIILLSGCIFGGGKERSLSSDCYSLAQSCIDCNKSCSACTSYSKCQGK